MLYSEKFREKMVAKMTGPNGRSASSLSKEVGVGQATLSRWLRRAKDKPMSDQGSGKRRRWSSSEKIRIVMAATAAGDSGLGELLRREGLHAADLESFRDEVLSAAAEGLDARRPKRRGLSPEQKELRAVKKELARKEKALAEAAALLVLRGKMQAFFGADEEGDTNDRNEK